MDTALKVFQNPAFGCMRTLTENGETRFCGSDVARLLAYDQPQKALARHCRYCTKRTVPHPQNPEKEIEMIFIPEGDVYRLIARSKLPAAEAFERWIFDEVLPSIRKTGGYIAGQETMTDDELVAAALLVANRRIKERDARIKELEAQAEANAPKVLYADTVAASEGGMLIREYCKFLRQHGADIGEKRMFADLRERGFLIKAEGRDKNKPTQRAMDMRLFTVKETSINKPDGKAITRTTPLLTGKGRIYFAKWYLSDRAVAALG